MIKTGQSDSCYTLHCQFCIEHDDQTNALFVAVDSITMWKKKWRNLGDNCVWD